MIRSLVSLVKVVVNPAEHRPARADPILLLGIWRFTFFIWRLPRVFTAKKSLRWLLSALGLFEDHAGCAGVIWRHVSLLFHIQQILQIKACNPLKGESSAENIQTLAKFQTKYGEFLPPLSSPPPLPSLSQ
jgi:hypothetical protein